MFIENSGLIGTFVSISSLQGSENISEEEGTQEPEVLEWCLQDVIQTLYSWTLGNYNFLHTVSPNSNTQPYLDSVRYSTTTTTKEEKDIKKEGDTFGVPGEYRREKKVLLLSRCITCMKLSKNNGKDFFFQWKKCNNMLVGYPMTWVWLLGSGDDIYKPFAH